MPAVERSTLPRPICQLVCPLCLQPLGFDVIGRRYLHWLGNAKSTPCANAGRWYAIDEPTVREVQAAEELPQ